MAQLNDAVNSARPDVDLVLSGLKPFQRRSVDYVFDRLYGNHATPRFLLADEVGLGKTVVARGVIARAVDRLWDERERIDIVYICSNHDIARQNINRLNITGKKDFALASRITLLPISIQSGQLREQKLNFVSFTPGTSFDLKSSLGVSTERVLLYHLLAETWDFSGAGPRNVLQGGSSPENFRDQLNSFPKDYTVDPGMAELFLNQIKKDRKLKNRFLALCEDYHRADAKVDPKISQMRSALVGELRETLAGACLKALKPDLIILDEFQRFKHLLVDPPDSPASQLAHDLFRYSDQESAARVLMLSATPYKMYTMGHELAEEDHYSDFLRTIGFLFGNPTMTTELETLLKEYRRLLYHLDQDGCNQIMTVRQELERCLRGVMCRTERLSVTADRSGMLEEVSSRADWGPSKLEPADLQSYLALQRVARTLKYHDTMELWKSSPYLLSFMEHYALKQNLRSSAQNSEVVAAFKTARRGQGVLLPWDRLGEYKPIEARNPRLRDLIRDTADCGAWRALWMPPSIPYYNLNGVFAGLAATRFTKRLVFSSWQVVPRTIATLVSYEVERRMITSLDPEAQNTVEARKTRRPLLNFASSKGRLTGMPVLGLMYPSFFLARQFDPLRYMCERPAGAPLDAAEILSLIENEVSGTIGELVKDAPDSGPEDEAWYWAAPILLDEMSDPAARQWWAERSLPTKWSGTAEESEADEDALGGTAGWEKHVAEARQMVTDPNYELGRPPKDLAQVVAQMALAGPAVTALRAISRISGGLDQVTDPLRRHMAGKVAFGFRALFNAPDVIALIRGQNGAEPYWRRVLEYCVGGCLQAVLDEYAHVLRDSLGSADAAPPLLAADVAKEIAAALNLQVAHPGADKISVDESSGGLAFENRGLRAWFAMRFGDEKDAYGSVSRADQVRKAFNSPFWPFVLATTSVGQEGLDFHTYCHAVMHWNLPANPVDMEQREGRIHRYKGHAVRRNVALRHASGLTNAEGDPWAQLFEIARKASSDASGLTPFWVYTAEGGATIERHVPVLPLSREANQLPALRNSLAVYRMVFGQPRQDDLVEFLLRQLPREALASLLDQLRIDLSPPDVTPQGTVNEAMAASAD
jgi:hypothetical protein